MIHISDSDVIQGRRLTDAESWHLMLPDLPMMDKNVLDEVLSPFSLDIVKHDCRDCPCYKDCIGIAKLNDSTIIKCIFYQRLFEDVNNKEQQ